MSPIFTTVVEWGATLLSLAGFWLCIQHRAGCFVVFFVADLGWFTSALLNFHPSLLAQQVVYLLLNVVGYVLWRREDRLRAQLEELEERALAADEDDEKEELLAP